MTKAGLTGMALGGIPRFLTIFICTEWQLSFPQATRVLLQVIRRVTLRVCRNSANFRGYKKGDFYELVTVVLTAMTGLVVWQTIVTPKFQARLSVVESEASPWNILKLSIYNICKLTA